MRNYSIKVVSKTTAKMWSLSATSKEEATSKALKFHKDTTFENGQVSMIIAF